MSNYLENGKMIDIIGYYWKYGVIGGLMVIVIFMMGSCVHANAVVSSRSTSDPYEVAGVLSCSGPGFCWHTETGYNIMNGEIDMRHVYGYHHSCGGDQSAVFTRQKMTHERRNGGVFESVQTLSVRTNGPCEIPK